MAERKVLSTVDFDVADFHENSAGTYQVVCKIGRQEITTTIPSYGDFEPLLFATVQICKHASACFASLIELEGYIRRTVSARAAH